MEKLDDSHFTVGIVFDLLLRAAEAGGDFFERGETLACFAAGAGRDAGCSPVGLLSDAVELLLRMTPKTTAPTMISTPDAPMITQNSVFVCVFVCDF